MIRVALVDDHEIVRLGIRKILDDSPDIDILGEADTGDDGYKLYLSVAPDVLLLDMNMPGCSGLALLGQLVARDSEAKVIMLSSHEEMTFAIQAIGAGAKGYILKSSSSEEVMQAIRTVANGNSYLSAEVAQNIALQNLIHQENPLQKLTSREFEIFRLLAEGVEIDVIAERLKIGPKTVANYQTTLKHKLNIATPVQMVRLALKHHVVSL